ncbi:MAG: MoaD/ThiS family protein [Synergistaceae bacterium]|nr:MoaD/ThiS family protein [Synergistaceae bacterium]
MKVEFFATIRELTGDKEITVEKAAAMGDLLRLLLQRYGASLGDKIFDGEKLSDDITILVNGMHIASTGGLETPLSDGDEVAIFPIVGGG